MTYTLKAAALYRTMATQRQQRSLASRLASRISRNLLAALQQQELPLAWHRLEGLELEGVLECGICATLRFTGWEKGVVIAEVHVDDAGSILQWGSSYGNLLY